MERKKKSYIKLRTLRSGLINPFKNRKFKVLEDSNDLSFLGAIAAQGTNEAYKNALQISDTIVQLKDGKVVRKRKDGPSHVVAELEARKVVIKGSSINLR